MKITLLTLFILISIGCRQNEKALVTENPKLKVGIQVSPAMTLVMVAEAEGFFDKQGVDVELVEFTAGKFALQAFLSGSIDIAVSGEVPVCLSTLQGNKFHVIAQVVERTTNECRVVVRNEDGPVDASRYFHKKKRKLSTSFGGGPEFFTYNFLKKNGIAFDKVELVSQKPEDMPAALESGSVDAISIFDPFARIAELKMGSGAITYADSSLYSELYVCDVMEETISEKPDALRSFLRGLVDAELFISENPDEAKKIMMEYTKLDRQVVDDIWDNFVFAPSLNDLLIDYLTAEANWALEKGTFPASTPIPNFRTVVYSDLLLDVAPSNVQLSSE